jgi:hypothetical protein
MFFQSGDIVMVAYAAKDGTTANDGPGRKLSAPSAMQAFCLRRAADYLEQVTR